MIIYNHKSKITKILKNHYLNQSQELQLCGNKQQMKHNIQIYDKNKKPVKKTKMFKTTDQYVANRDLNERHWIRSTHLNLL